MSLPFTPEYMASEPYFGEDILEVDEVNSTTSTKNDGDFSQAEGATPNPRNTVTNFESDPQCSTATASNSQSQGNLSQASIRDIGMESGINTSDRTKYSFFRIARRMIAMRLYQFSDEFEIVGVYKLAKKCDTFGSVIRKVVWTMLLLFGVGFMGFQIYQKISYYLSWPTTVSYQFAYNTSLRFPTVTVCPETFASRKAVNALDPGIAQVAAEVWPPFPDVDFHPDYKRFGSAEWNVDWGQFYLGFAPQNEEILLECQFNNAPCNSTEALQRTITDFGLCFSFNPSKANYVTSEPGATHGLRLVLWTNQSDSLITMSPAAGFRMMMHDPNEMPNIQSVGFRVSPGTFTSVSFTFKNISQLPAPYGYCRDDQNYTFMKCMTSCEGQFILDKCGCRPVQLQVPGPVCNPEQYAECALNMTKYFISSGESRKCDCPIQCIQHKYPYSISASRLSQLFLNHTLQQQKFKGRKLTMSRLDRELVYLEVFYSQLTYTDIQTFPAYSILDLVCETGGAFGLILGGSVLSVAQIIQFAIQLIGDVKLAFKYSRKSAA